MHRVSTVAIVLGVCVTMAGQAVRPQVIDGHIASHAQEPGEERDTAVVVLDERGHELRENVLRDVLRLVIVAHDGAHVAVDVV